MHKNLEYIVVGAGIAGLGTAYNLKNIPDYFDYFLLLFHSDLTGNIFNNGGIGSK